MRARTPAKGVFTFTALPFTREAALGVSKVPRRRRPRRPRAGNSLPCSLPWRRTSRSTPSRALVSPQSTARPRRSTSRRSRPPGAPPSAARRRQPADRRVVVAADRREVRRRRDAGRRHVHVEAHPRQDDRRGVPARRRPQVGGGVRRRIACAVQGGGRHLRGGLRERGRGEGWVPGVAGAGETVEHLQRRGKELV